MGNPGNLQNILRDLSQINFIQIGFIIAGAWVLTLIIRRGLAWLAQRYTGRLRLFFFGRNPRYSVDHYRDSYYFNRSPDNPANL